MDINIIKTNGTKLDLDWYLYNGEYYFIPDDEIKYKTTDVIINSNAGFFSFPLSSPYGACYFIRGFLKIALGTDYRTIQAFNDGYYTRPFNNGKGSVLCYVGLGDNYPSSDTVFFTEDGTIYRLTNNLFVSVSGGVHYLIKVNNNGEVVNEPYPAGTEEVYIRGEKLYTRIYGVETPLAEELNTRYL